MAVVFASANLSTVLKQDKVLIHRDINYCQRWWDSEAQIKLYHQNTVETVRSPSDK
jgi:hypothetical protein